MYCSAEKKTKGTEKGDCYKWIFLICQELHPDYKLSSFQSEVLAVEKDKKKEDNPETRLAQGHGSPPPSQLSDTEDFTGLETTSLLEHGDTVLHISEDNGMENPQFTFTHVEVGQTDTGLDESHVWFGRAGRGDCASLHTHP